MTYTVELAKRAQRQLKALPEVVQKRLNTEINTLAINPRPPGVKAMQGMRGLLRLRVGDYRIIYQVQDDRLVVLVVAVGHRSKVYKSF